MITSTEAVNVLIDVCKGKGTYTIRQHSTRVRDFKPSYEHDSAGFNYDKQLNDKILVPYRPHAWINN